MRKLAVLTVSIVSALLIAACGSGTKTVTVAKTPTTVTTTIGCSSAAPTDWPTTAEGSRTPSARAFASGR
jgi:hypothetical protein